jgi:UDP-N-acetylglucosamine 4,6-dehydratase
VKPIKGKGVIAAFAIGVRAVTKYRLPVAIFIMASLGEGLFQGLLVWALRRALVIFSDPQSIELGGLTLAALLIFGVSMAQAATEFLAQVMSVRIANRVEIDWMWRVLSKILTLPIRFFDKHSQGDLIMAAYQDLQGIRGVTEELGKSILYVARLLGLAAVAFILSPKLTIVGFVAVPLVAIPTYWLGQKITRAARLHREGLSLWHDSFMQVSTGIRIIKVNRSEERILARAKQIAGSLYIQVVRQAQLRGMSRFLLETVSGLGLILVLALGGRDIAAGTLDWQSLMGLLIAVLAVYAPIVNLLETYSRVRGYIPNLEHVELVLSAPAMSQDQTHAVPLREAPQTIELRDVSFAYDNQIILDALSATFRRGETIGIVGPSGTGKSTLIALLLRFYEPTSGRILFDGVDLHDIRHADLMDRCAIVLQEPVLFIDTVANNIRLARPDAPMSEVIEAAKAANIHDEIMLMEKGYETLLGVSEEGRGLSVGQKQRVCIAAALLKNAPLLFLDEATSNLDVVSERKVQDAIDNLMIGRTTFVITHRLSALRNTDRTLVINQGKVVGLGTHQELLQSCEAYQRLWSFHGQDDTAKANGNGHHPPEELAQSTRIEITSAPASYSASSITIPRIKIQTEQEHFMDTKDLPSMDWSDQSVLVTGGTGSFGRKFTEIVLQHYHPKRLIIFSRDELKQHEMRQIYPDTEGTSMRYFIGDVRDADRLRRAMNGVDIVVHAAALKQVPACEYNPIEAILTNVTGAKNVIEAALDTGVKKVLALSTDKAVNPVNLYGATKLVAEKLFVQANAYSGEGPTRFSCVRYGNVVGSRGSVIPLFLKQRETGKVTVTDPRMTRFWITLEQGVHFVLRCIHQMYGGEVFVPKLASVNMMDLVASIAPGCEVQQIGIRPGEKLHEALISEDEARHSLDLQDMYVVKPPHPWWFSENWVEGRPLSDGFHYTSDNNSQWLKGPELEAFIEECMKADGYDIPKRTQTNQEYDAALREAVGR